MRRRILATMVLVTAVAVTTLFVPAALAIRSRDLSAQAVEVQRDAAVAAAAIAPGDPAQAQLPDDDAYGLYRRDGTLVNGRGPARAEPAVLEAFGGEPTLTADRHQQIAALLIRGDPPISSFVLRVAEPRSEARRATVLSIARLGAAALLIVAGAAVAAAVLARRLARPVEHLRTTAAQLDDGDFTATTAPTGLPEVDQVARTLAHTGERIQSAIERERSFSADASHQLRTPLAAMRAAVEAEQLDPRDDAGEILGEVLGQIDRLDDTLTSLLALARDTHHDRRPVDLTELVRGAGRRWSPRLAASGRELRVAEPSRAPKPSVSPTALDHVLDVLLDNSLRHGAGAVTLRVDDVGGAARIAVADEGHLDRDVAHLFARRPAEASGTGIGLHLARALVEAEGGRLYLAGREPTTFEVALPLRPDRSSGGSAATSRRR